MDPPRGLQEQHGYVTQAFPRLVGRADADAFALDDAALRRYEADGFLHPVRVLDAAMTEAVAARVDWLQQNARALEPRLYEVELAWTERPGEVVFHCLGGWLVDELLHDLIFHPAITVPLAQCLGLSRLRFWHDQVFAKPPRHPGVVPWHQDYSYWQRATPPAHVTLHLALDDADEESGCVHYVPGSHRWGLLDKVSFGGGMDALGSGLSAEQRAAFRPVAARLRRGEAVIHHSHVVHGSWSNRSERPRRAVVLNYMAPTTRSAGTEPLLRGTPPVPPGQVIEGDWFPIVLDLARLP